jgi:signal transduction histidine kinase
MLRAIGHEVRSPAAAMRATIASLIHWNEVIDSSQRKTLLDSAYDQSQRLLALVEGQLIISQLETGRFQPNPEPVDLRKSINDILGLLRFRYGERTEVISVDLPERTPQAHCEATHLGQVLMNLLSNALEYSLGGVWLRVKAHPGWVEVTVEDSGQGVPSERIESLFTRQVPAGQKRARGGLGLGLYLCRLVVERSLGGRIWLDRNGSHGAVFKFTVPASPPSRPLPEGSSSEVASPRSTIGGDG